MAIVGIALVLETMAVVFDGLPLSAKIMKALTVTSYFAIAALCFKARVKTGTGFWRFASWFATLSVGVALKMWFILVAYVACSLLPEIDETVLTVSAGILAVCYLSFLYRFGMRVGHEP